MDWRQANDTIGKALDANHRIMKAQKEVIETQKAYIDGLEPYIRTHRYLMDNANRVAALLESAEEVLAFEQNQPDWIDDAQALLRGLIEAGLKQEDK